MSLNNPDGTPAEQAVEAPSTTMSNGSTFRLLMLPAEIRAIIFRCYYEDTTVWSLRYDDTACEKDHSPVRFGYPKYGIFTGQALLLVCRLVYQEALVAFHQTAIFDYTKETCSPLTSHDVPFLSRLNHIKADINLLARADISYENTIWPGWSRDIDLCDCAMDYALRDEIDLASLKLQTIEVDACVDNLRDCPELLLEEVQDVLKSGHEVNFIVNILVGGTETYDFVYGWDKYPVLTIDHRYQPIIRHLPFTCLQQKLLYKAVDLFDFKLEQVKENCQKCEMCHKDLNCVPRIGYNVSPCDAERTEMG